MTLVDGHNYVLKICEVFFLSFKMECINNIYPVKIKKGIVYINCDPKNIRRENIMSSNVGMDFLKIKNNTDLEEFLMKYGPLENVGILRQRFNFSLLDIPVVDNFIPICTTAEIYSMINELRSFLEWMDYCMCAVKSNDRDDDHLEDVKGLLFGSLDLVNEQTFRIPMKVCFDENYNLWRVYEPRSLKEAIYIRIVDALTKKQYIKQCECGCGEWFDTDKEFKKYYNDGCAKRASKRRNREGKADDIKERTYTSVREHFNYLRRSCTLNRYVYADWLTRAQDIKKKSNNYFFDLDNLCKEHCACSKCKDGIATFFKDKWEQKLNI